MARPSNTEQRRLEIARGLAKVMAANGYDGASVADIATAAGLTAGLVHYHFDNKLEILLALVDDLQAHHRALLTKALAQGRGDPARELDIFIDVHLAVGRNADPQRLACWIAISAEAVRQRTVGAAYQRALAELADTLEQIITRGVKTKAFRTRDPRAAALALLATIQGYLTIAGSARVLIPSGSAAGSARAMARGLLERRS